MQTEKLVVDAVHTAGETLPGRPLLLFGAIARLWFSRAIKHSILQKTASCCYYRQPDKSYARNQNIRSPALILDPQGHQVYYFFTPLVVGIALFGLLVKALDALKGETVDEQSPRI